MSDGSKMTPKEKALVVEIGSRWLRMPDRQVLDEAAILFRLGVAIVNCHAALRERKSQPSQPEKGEKQ